jgi:type III secretory pathway component EscT
MAREDNAALGRGTQASVSIVAEVARAFADAGVDLAALGLAWARVAPTVALVPAFGLRALPVPVRGVLGLALAAAIFPALVPATASAAAARFAAAPWPLLAIEEIVRGLPIALAAAVPLWAATMAGGVVDTLRGAQDTLTVPTLEGRATLLGVPLALLAGAIFLASGAPSRVVSALATRELPAHPVLAAARDLTSGITLAVAVGGPLLAAAIVLEIAAALVARAATPAQIHALLAPLRALALLFVMALVLDRIAAVLGAAVAGVPG